MLPSSLELGTATRAWLICQDCSLVSSASPKKTPLLHGHIRLASRHLWRKFLCDQVSSIAGQMLHVMVLDASIYLHSQVPSMFFYYMCRRTIYPIYAYDHIYTDNGSTVATDEPMNRCKAGMGQLYVSLSFIWGDRSDRAWMWSSSQDKLCGRY